MIEVASSSRKEPIPDFIAGKVWNPKPVRLEIVLRYTGCTELFRERIKVSIEPELYPIRRD